MPETKNKNIFKNVKSNVDYVAMENDILKFWHENDIFKKSIELRKDSPKFVFYEGPPTANGKPGSHHVLARSFKDIVCRYRVMKGYLVERKAGWDTHGLPVELEVEKELGISGKPDIEKYGIAKFNAKCKESVMKYTSDWENLTERIAFWLDMRNPYITYTNGYIESVWWTIKQIWEKGLLYEGYKVVPHCPRCGTSLSSHEVAQGYKWVKENSVYVKFKSKDEPDTYYLAWTTTPWTLSANVSLAVSPNANYVVVEDETGEKLILSETLAGEIFGDKLVKVIKKIPGKELEGKKYEPLFDFYPESENSHKITLGDFVTLKEGTGIVHIAPAFGQDDMNIATKYNMPVYHPVKEDGTYGSDVKLWEGKFVKDADPLIIDELRSQGKLFKTAIYEHSYPFCWRCDTPLLYFAKSSWFIKTTALKDRLTELNKEINWEPAHIKEGRFGKWLETLVDWSLSRERYWGTPLPVWRCKSCDEILCVGSVEELKELSTTKIDNIDLHRPFVDEIKIKCKNCGDEMNRIEEVTDCWFDSGAMPHAQWNYPVENKEIFKENFPADFICEAIDQTRGWFYSLHVISTLVFDSISYKNVICLGHILDENGEKMSKHKGNVIEPWTILDREGADAFRWYLFTVSPPGSPKKFSEEGVKEVLRKFLLTLWNTYSFFVTYANIDGFNPLDKKCSVKDRPLMDRWIISKLNSLVKSVNSSLEKFQITAPSREIAQFVDDLSNWYVRRSRRRFWKSEEDTDKLCAYQTLYEILVTVSKLLAPFVPFISDELYRNLVISVDKNAGESIHLTDYPNANEDLIDLKLEKQIDAVRQIVTLGRSARFKSKIKVRQPLSEMWVFVPDKESEEAFQNNRDQILEELNIKKVVEKSSAQEFISYQVKPNLPVLGPRLGKLISNLNDKLSKLNGREIKSQVEQTGEISVDVNGEKISLTKDDLLFSEIPIEGFVVESDRGFFVGISTGVSPDLYEEGIAREFVHMVQAMRKDAGLNIEDNIELSITGEQKLLDISEKFSKYISSETLSKKFEIGSAIQGYSEEKNIDGFKVTASLKKIG